MVSLPFEVRWPTYDLADNGSGARLGPVCEPEGKWILCPTHCAGVCSMVGTAFGMASLSGCMPANISDMYTCLLVYLYPTVTLKLAVTVGTSDKLPNFSQREKSNLAVKYLVTHRTLRSHLVT